MSVFKRISLKIILILVGILVLGYVLLSDKFENYYMTINENSISPSCTITKFKGIKQKINIPATINNIPVTEIGEQAFCGKDLIKIKFMPDKWISNDFNIEKGKTSPNDSFNEWLGEWLYKKTRGKIVSVVIPEGIINIGPHAFSSNKITRIDIGPNVDMNSTSFDLDFYSFYMNNGKKAGKYTFLNGRWNYE